MKPNKKRLANEWLIFITTLILTFLLFALIAIFVAMITTIVAIIGGESSFLGEIYIELFDAIFGWEGGVYLFILMPYILVQFIRLIIWSIKKF